MSKCYDDPQLQELANLTIYSIQRDIKTTREPVKKRNLQKPENALRAPGLLVLYILRVLRKCVLCGERQGTRRKRRRGEMC